MLETLEDTYPKARKNHICNFCAGLIPRGDKYHYQVIVNDGDIYTWKSHLHCDEIANVMDMYDFAYDDGLDAYSFQQYNFSLFLRFPDGTGAGFLHR